MLITPSDREMAVREIKEIEEEWCLITKRFMDLYPAWNTRRSFLSLIRFLPNEILSYILALACRQLYYTERYLFPSVVNRVSKHWYSVARSTPSLWTYIHLGFLCSGATPELIKQRLADRVVMMKALRVKVTISDYDDVGDLVYLERLHDRIASVDISANTWDELENLMGIIPQLPNLHTVYISGPHVGTRKHLMEHLNTPKSLKSLEVTGVIWDWESFCLNGLEHLDLSFEVGDPDILQVLARNPGLRVVDLSCITDTAGDDNLLLEAHRSVSLPSLRRFTMRNYSAKWVSHVLSALDAPGLQELDFFIHPDSSAPQRRRSGWANFAPHFPNLTALRIRGFEDLDELLYGLFPERISPSLHNIYISPVDRHCCPDFYVAFTSIHFPNLISLTTARIEPNVVRRMIPFHPSIERVNIHWSDTGLLGTAKPLAFAQLAFDIEWLKEKMDFNIISLLGEDSWGFERVIYATLDDVRENRPLKSPATTRGWPLL